MSENCWKCKKTWFVRIDNLEVSSCDERLDIKGIQSFAEICEWNKDNTARWTIAYFVDQKDGYELRFVGNRPLEDTVDWELFKRICEIGFSTLNTIRRHNDRN